MKTLYRVNWSTKDIETAKLIDEHNLNDGASVETWLCKDKNGRKFTCSKFDLGYRFSELEAWQVFEEEMRESVKSSEKYLQEMQKELEEAKQMHSTAKQKVSELSAKD